MRMLILALLAQTEFCFAQFSWERTYSPTTDGGRIWEMCVDSSGRIYAYCEGRGIYVAPDGGTNWQITGYTDDMVVSMSASPGGAIFAATAARLFRTTDQGTIWTQVLPSPGAYAVGSVCATPSGSVLLATRSGMLRSIDGGTTWGPIETRLASAFVSTPCVTRGKGGHSFALADSGVYRSADDGANWQLVRRSTAVERLWHIAVNSSEHLFLTVNRTDIPAFCIGYRSTDLGATWQNFGPGCPTLFWEISVTPTNELLVANSGTSLYRSTNEGAEWNLWSSNAHFYCMEFLSTGTYFGGKEDGIWASRDGGQTWSRIGVPLGVPPALSFNIELHQCFPNPFNAAARIRFDLPGTMTIRLEILDLLGRSVAILREGIVPAGMHTVDFDARDLGSGVYFSRLTTPIGRLTKSMLLVR